ncbi:hypothetical protein [uncultured Solobacterium sp.]|uniref:hypothetical protein n=1 Tax=uncultured Solobacterium sp. TaxID=747375 RepID=UPI0028E43C21|nr:hypothetical protein [uncultured Solobacterium sp.]
MEEIIEFVKTYWNEILTNVISALALFFAIRANSIAKKANDEAKKANVFSKKSLSRDGCYFNIKIDNILQNGNSDNNSYEICTKDGNFSIENITIYCTITNFSLKTARNISLSGAMNDAQKLTLEPNKETEFKIFETCNKKPISPGAVYYPYEYILEWEDGQDKNSAEVKFFIQFNKESSNITKIFLWDENFEIKYN